MIEDYKKITKEDMLGKVVWDIINRQIILRSQNEESKETDKSNQQSERDLFLITGLNVLYLKGISNQIEFQKNNKTQSIAFKVSRKIADIHIIDEEFLTDESAVFFRHSTMANLILFAISNDELNTIGASLNPISRINRTLIQENIDIWLNYIDQTNELNQDERRRWLKCLLKGLNQSKIIKSIDQFIDFIHLLNMNINESWNERIQKALISLHLPKNAIDLSAIENLKTASELKDSVLSEKFEQIFKNANREIACFLYLVDAYNRPLNRDILKRNLENRFNGIEKNDSEYETYKAVDTLIKDYNLLRPGEWIPSQQDFCEKVDWSLIEKDIFEKKEKPKNLGDLTHEFIQEKHPKRENDLEKYLNHLKTNQSALKDDFNFFEQYQSDIEKYSKKLYNTWVHHLYPQEIKSSDLMIVFLKAIRNLIIKANQKGLISLTDHTIYVFLKNGYKEELWKHFNEKAHHFFQYEGNLIKSALKDLIEIDFGIYLNTIEKSKTNISELEFDFFLIKNDVNQTINFEKMSKNHFVKTHATWTFHELSQYFHDEIKQLNDQKAKFDDAYFYKKDSFHRKKNDNDNENINFFKKYIEKIDVEELNRLQESTIEHSHYNDLNIKFKDFIVKYKQSIQAIYNHQDIFITNDIEEQVQAFSELCQIVRSKIDFKEYRKNIADIAIIKITDPDEHLLIPGWHPLRLFEKKVKLTDFRSFVKHLTSSEVDYENLEKSFKDREEAYIKWSFPEILYHDSKLYKTVVDHNALSIAIPLDHYISYQKNQSISDIVSSEYQKILSKYLNLYPHEETCFSTMIYNLENLEITEQIILAIQKEMLKRENFRCHLYLYHEDISKRNHIYREQNAKLQKIVYDETKDTGISRLHVSMANENQSDIDILLNYQNISYYYTQYDWQLNEKSSKRLDQQEDCNDDLNEIFQQSMLPRIKQKDGRIDYHLSVGSSTTAYAEFLNLCYSIEKNVYSLDGKMAELIQYISWKKDHISEKIDKALFKIHDKARWVISIDQLMNSQFLLDHQIKVIRDISISNYDFKLLVSSKESNKYLFKNLKKEFEKISYFNIDQKSSQLSELLLESLIEVCGQKILGISNSNIETRELIGLYITKLLIKRELKHINPIWISLDDHKSFFGLKGELADLLCIWIEETEGKFDVFLNVVESKYRSNMNHLLSACDSSMKQIESTLSTLKDIFNHQKDLIHLQSWGLSLLKLINVKPSFSYFFKNDQQLNRFKSAILKGELKYIINGISVVIDFDKLNNKESKEIVYRVENWVTQYLLSQYQLSCMLVKEDISLKQTNDLIEYSIIPDTMDIPNTDVDVTDVVNETNGSSSVEEPKPIQIEEISKTIQKTINPYIPHSVIKVLKEIQDKNNTISYIEDDIDLKLHKLFRALQNSNLNPKFHENKYTKTPNGLIIHFNGELFKDVKNQKTQVDRLKSALRTVYALNITDIRLDLGRVSFFIAATHRTLVRLEDVWLNANWSDSLDQQSINFLIGIREDNGEHLWLNLSQPHGENLEHAPHTLIVGETGSGKGVLTQNLLLQIILFQDPNHLKLYVIDPKHGIDFSWISDAPHLSKPIATTQSEAEVIFNELVNEMENRYKKFQSKGVSKLSEYNAIVEDKERLATCIMVHDEMADWMLSSPDYTEIVKSLVTRLATKARAAGIHLIMITQRASQEAIPPWIRENLGNRLCLKVSNDRGSILALGDRGAENLLGKGHLMAKLNGDRSSSTNEYFIAQVPFASSEILKDLAKLSKL
jgi:S-DNA-T family DNA segregation ATPase FtsK/SpoIIIE